MENLIYIARKGIPRFYGQSAIGHTLNILNDDDWQKLNDSAKDIQDHCSLQCSDSIKKQKTESEKRYGVKIGKTDIRCLRCGKSCVPVEHVCADMVVQKMQEGRQKALIRTKIDSDESLKILPKFGVQKLATLVKVPKETISSWIKRESIPKKYLERVVHFLQPALSSTSIRNEPKTPLKSLDFNMAKNGVTDPS